ncbi:SH3 domain-containing protein [Neolewinella persica]|uniref:SH3 domain-containing protein n=1 Tax=Neolewinella persica TaxID=70998 RepID=UPI000376D0B5|nr:SH3 domain-containing protein [Neolewinella persica]
MNSLLKASLICLALTLNACGGNEPAATDTPIKPTDKTTQRAEFAPKPPAADSYNAGDLLYPWVDQLNVRETPNTKAKRVGNAAKGQPVTLSGEKTEKKETIVLRGIAYDDYWLKVTTKEETEGWVFAGALKREGEFKGNEVVTDTRFKFQAFGDYDLSQWKETDRTDDSGGDAESTTVIYQKDDQVLKITRTDVGEYGYTNTFTLTDAGGNLLKARVFTFEVDPELLIRETVIDYLSMKEYVRSQPMSKHFMQLNERPQMVSGEWKVTEL